MKKTLTIIGTILLVAAIAAPVLAYGPGRGKGQRMIGYWKGGPGYCWQDRRGYENLTEGQRSQLDRVHQKFYDETAQLRDEIWSKSAELNTLLNSSNPDAEKAKALQNEISDLRAKIAEKRLDLELEARKIVPGGVYARSWRMGSGMGPGMMHPGWGMGPGMMGPGMGRGYGPGPCWN